MKRYCLACDLKNDEAGIRAYDDHHKNIWPEIKESLKQSGIHEMEIFRTGNRLMMIIQVDESFSFERKYSMDEANPVVQKWEALMSNYQQQIPWAKPAVKWLLMERVFHFEA